MKIALIIFLWFFAGLIALFIFLLFCRLNGDDPDELYDVDPETYGFYVIIIILSPITFSVAILFAILVIIRKFMIALVEVIVACKELREDDNEKERK